jgi:amino acid permease
MAYTAPQGIWGSYIALGFCCLIALTKNFTAFLNKKPDGSLDKQKFAEEFITGYDMPLTHDACIRPAANNVTATLVSRFTWY